MANTFSQIYIHIVFAVKGRSNLISSNWEDRLYQYITTIVHNKGQKMMAINGMPDHIHIFIGMKPECSISDLVREIKKSSNQFIKVNKLTNYKFEWQAGFGAFSYNKSQVHNVVNYVLNQKQHHQKKSFQKEYLEILDKFEIKYDEKYLFEWYD